VIFSFLILCKFCAHKKEFNKTQQKQKMTRFVLFWFGLVVGEFPKGLMG
jgi:hypothetical protein